MKHRHFFWAIVCAIVMTRPLGAIDNTAAVQVTPLLKTQAAWNGQALQWPAGAAEAQMLQVDIAVGAETGWHRHPVPSFAWVLEGELEVQLKTGERLSVKKGDGFAEVVNTWHNGRNVGKTPVRLLVMYASSVGTPLSEKAPNEQRAAADQR